MDRQCNGQQKKENRTNNELIVLFFSSYFVPYVTSFPALSIFDCPFVLPVSLHCPFLAHLAFRPGELLSSLFVRRLLSVVRPSTFHILIFSSETTGPIATKLWWNGPWMAPFQNCVR
jgi:hypothetical protein